MTADTITFMFVLAQIAGVYIGFGALISASKSSTATKREAKTLATIVYIGINVVICALMPPLLDKYGLSIEWSLRIGAIVFLIMTWAVIVSSWSTVVEGIRKKTASSALFWIQESAIQIPLIFILLGIFRQHSEALYLTALVIASFEAAQLLVQLVFTIPTGIKN